MKMWVKLKEEDHHEFGFPRSEFEASGKRQRIEAGLGLKETLEM